MTCVLGWTWLHLWVCAAPLAGPISGFGHGSKCLAWSGVEMKVWDNDGPFSPGLQVLLRRPGTTFSSGTALLQPEQEGLVRACASGTTQH